MFFVSSYRYNITVFVLWRKQIWILKQKSYTKKRRKKVSVFLRATLLYFPPVFILRSFVNLKGLGETFLTSCCSMVSFFFIIFLRSPYYLQSFCANKKKFIKCNLVHFLGCWWVWMTLIEFWICTYLVLRNVKDHISCLMIFSKFFEIHVLVILRDFFKTFIEEFLNIFFNKFHWGISKCFH